jgi:hypothetical protein
MLLGLETIQPHRRWGGPGAIPGIIIRTTAGVAELADAQDSAINPGALKTNDLQENKALFAHRTQLNLTEHCASSDGPRFYQS